MVKSTSISRIVVIPAGDETVASARIRAYSLIKQLTQRNISYSLQYLDRPRVVFVQKRLTDEIIAYAKRARGQGSLIAYDVDDLGEALEYWASPGHLKKMLEMADIVFTATSDQTNILKREYDIHQATAVIGNCIDYYLEKPERAEMEACDSLRIFWFGNASNFRLLEKYLDLFLAVPKVKITVCTDIRAMAKSMVRWPKVDFVQWTLETFPRILQSQHISFLMHDGTDFDRAKANNRMVTSIAWGVPAIVSRTPAYSQTAAEAGVPESTFENEYELRALIEKYRDSGERIGYLDKAQKSVWNRYSPSAIANQYIGEIELAIGRLGELTLHRKIFRRVQSLT